MHEQVFIGSCTDGHSDETLAGQQVGASAGFTQHRAGYIKWREAQLWLRKVYILGKLNHRLPLRLSLCLKSKAVQL